MKIKYFFLGITLSSIQVVHADFVAKVIEVHDGDTITVLTQNNKQYQVRLANIDAPELTQKFGERSKKVLADFIYNSPVYIKEQGQDKYGRVVATVLKGNDDVNRLMVRYGFAWAYREYLTDKVMLNLESYAQQQKIGIWQNAENISPEQWRRMKNQQLN